MHALASHLPDQCGMDALGAIYPQVSNVLKLYNFGAIFDKTPF